MGIITSKQLAEYVTSLASRTIAPYKIIREMNKQLYPDFALNAPKLERIVKQAWAHEKSEVIFEGLRAILSTRFECNRPDFYQDKAVLRAIKSFQRNRLDYRPGDIFDIKLENQIRLFEEYQIVVEKLGYHPKSKELKNQGIGPGRVRGGFGGLDKLREIYNNWWEQGRLCRE